MGAHLLFFGFLILGFVFGIPALVFIVLGIRFQSKETLLIGIIPMILSIASFLAANEWLDQPVYIKLTNSLKKSEPLNQDSLDEIENSMGSALSTARNFDYSNGYPGDTINAQILGDFNGDQQEEMSYVHVLKEGVFDKSPFLLSIDFSSSTINSLEISANKNEIILINEGNLDCLDGDELSILLPPNHGCTYTLITYSYFKGEWKQLFEPILIPTRCDEISQIDLEGRIFIANGIVCYYETDVTTEEYKLIKKKIKLK